MAYTAEISRRNPTCFLFLIDRSGSMGDTFGGDPKRIKADGVADAINGFLYTLTIINTEENEVKDRFYVGVIGYGDNVGSAFSSVLSGKELVPLSEVAMNPARIETRAKKVEDGAGGIIEQSVRFPTWFAPIANGGTPMCQALKLAQSIIQKWLSQHPDCFPPIVMNITDGEATDGDPIIPAEALTRLSNNDGNVLLFNLHISSHRAPELMFPDTEEILPDKYAQLLFRMSSKFPVILLNEAQKAGYRVSENTRGFAFNVKDNTAVIQFLDIGTKVELR
jgi:hypothetical protein